MRKEALGLNQIPVKRTALLQKVDGSGFPGSPGVKSSPANAGDTDPTPGPGGSHMPQGNGARGAQLLQPALPRAGAVRREAAPMRHPCTPAGEQPPSAATRESRAQQ